jgi:predicted nucleic acid-binding protein
VFVALLDDVAARAYQVAVLEGDDYRRVRGLSDRYENGDLGFVDAAVLAVVERLDEDKLATLDERRFRTVRPRHVESLQLLPVDG